MSVEELDYDDPSAVASFISKRFDASDPVYRDDPESWDINLKESTLLVEVGHNSLNDYYGVEWVVRDSFDGEILECGGWRGEDHRCAKVDSLLGAVTAIKNI